MATTTNLTTTYAGEEAGEWNLKAFLAGETLQHITVKENVPGKLKVRRITDNATTFADQTCSFTPTGTVDLDERTLTLVDLAMQRELCKVTFYQDWEALAAQNGNIGSVSEALVATMAGNIGAINETMIWQGAAGAGAYDGFETLFAADATVLDVASPAAITASNVVAEIAKTVGTLPVRVRRASEKPKLYVASNVAEAYRNAQATLGNGTFFQAGGPVSMTWIGQYDIIECPGMSDSTMVFAQASNLWFGTNKTSDMNNIQLLDMQNVTGDKVVRYSADFFGAVQYGRGNEIAFYTV
jgi:hypothetical protein